MNHYHVTLRFHGIENPEKYTKSTYDVRATSEKQAIQRALNLKHTNSRGSVQFESVVMVEKSV